MRIIQIAWSINAFDWTHKWVYNCVIVLYFVYWKEIPLPKKRKENYFPETDRAGLSAPGQSSKSLGQFFLPSEFLHGTGHSLVSHLFTQHRKLPDIRPYVFCSLVYLQHPVHCRCSRDTCSMRKMSLPLREVPWWAWGQAGEYNASSPWDVHRLVQEEGLGLTGPLQQDTLNADEKGLSRGD